MDAHPARIDARGEQMRAAVSVLYFVPEKARGVNAKPETEAEAIVELDIVGRTRWRAAADTVVGQN